MKKPDTKKTYRAYHTVQFLSPRGQDGPWMCVGPEYDDGVVEFEGYDSPKEALDAMELYFEENEIEDKTGYGIIEEKRKLIKAYWS